MLPDTYNTLLIDVSNKVNTLLNQAYLAPYGYADPISDEGELPQSWDYKQGYTHVEGGWLSQLTGSEHLNLSDLRNGTTIYNNSFQTDPTKLTSKDVIIRLQTVNQIYIPQYREVKNNLMTLSFVSQPSYYTDKQIVQAWSKPLYTSFYYNLDFTVQDSATEFTINSSRNGATYLFGAPFLILTTTDSGWCEETFIDTNYTLSVIRGTLKTNKNIATNFKLLWR